MLRHELDLHDRFIGQVGNVRQPRDGRDDRPSADVEEDLVGADAVGPHFDLAHRGEPRLRLVNGDAWHGPQPCLDVARRSARDRILACLDLRHVDADVPADHDAVLGGARGEPGRIRTCDEGLGRHAACVDAGAAEAPALDYGDLPPRLRQAVGKRRAGLARPDDGRVVMLGHGRLPMLPVSFSNRRSIRPAAQPQAATA